MVGYGDCLLYIVTTEAGFLKKKSIKAIDSNTTSPIKHFTIMVEYVRPSSGIIHSLYPPKVYPLWNGNAFKHQLTEQGSPCATAPITTVTGTVSIKERPLESLVSSCDFNHCGPALDHIPLLYEIVLLQVRRRPSTESPHLMPPAGRYFCTGFAITFMRISLPEQQRYVAHSEDFQDVLLLAARILFLLRSSTIRPENLLKVRGILRAGLTSIRT